MYVFDLDDTEYAILSSSSFHVFNTVDFLRTVNEYTDKVVYLWMGEKSNGFGIVLGVKDDSLYSPFSAPYGGFNIVNPMLKLSVIQDSIKAFDSWASDMGYKSTTITLPPFIYDQHILSKLANSMLQSGYSLSTWDLNYHFDLSKLQYYRYNEILWKNARKNLRKSMASNLEFRKSESLSDEEDVYNIIGANREYKGFPLRMSFTQIQRTKKAVAIDFFYVRHNESKIASAIVYHVTKSIVLIVYWGDNPGYEAFRPMNFISHKIFDFYYQQGMSIVDIGPSTENSIPNHGLCEFKESIGASVTGKLTFKKNYE